MRESLARNALISLQDRSYTVQSFLGTHSCFDFVARKGSHTLLVKVLENIDGFREMQALELRKLAELFHALPLLVGEKSKKARLEKELVYERYGIPALSLDTFENVLDEKLPTSKSFKGQAIAELDGKKLKQAREKKRISVSELARRVNVSPETLYRYEQGFTASLEKVQKLEETLNVSLVKPVALKVSPFEFPKESEKKVEDRVLKQLRLLGVPLTSFGHAPFKAYAHPTESLLVGEAKQASEVSHKAETLQKSAKAFRAHAVLFAKDSKLEEVAGTPIVLESELKEFKKGKELLKLVKKRENR